MTGLIYVNAHVADFRQHACRNDSLSALDGLEDLRAEVNIRGLGAVSNVKQRTCVVLHGVQDRSTNGASYIQSDERQMIVIHY